MEESTATWWLNRLISRTKKIHMDWPYPLVEDKLFVLTLSAGLEGYRVNIDGRIVTSFPYRTVYVLKDATGLSVNGDIHIIICITFLLSHCQHLILVGRLECRQNGKHHHFLMDPMNYSLGSFLQVLLTYRTLVKQHGRTEVNIELKKEAEFFDDIVQIISSRYIMKCDDYTFVRIDSVMNQVKKVPSEKSLYSGNIKYHHKPRREGKRAVTYEEWPGFVVSFDIDHFVISDFEKHKLRLFKLEDVSMGMWVEQFNKSKTVEYISLKFYRFVCIDDYYTAHYQSPRQDQLMGQITSRKAIML